METEKYYSRKLNKEVIIPLANELSDEENVRFVFNCTSSKILRMIADGKIDAQVLAERELVLRGY